MNLDEYQEKSGQFASYPSPCVGGNEVRLVYPVLGLAEEVAELNEKIQLGCDTESVVKELGDVCWFVQEICTCIGIKMSDLPYPSNFGGGTMDVLAGQVCGILAKAVRDNDGVVPLGGLDAVKGKLCSILAWVIDIAGGYRVELDDVLRTNYSKLASRKCRGVIHGSGDYR